MDPIADPVGVALYGLDILQGNVYMSTWQSLQDSRSCLRIDRTLVGFQS
ncbi:MAG: hypothetical protein ACYC27_12110 [Armatimonadota bacterium]